MLNVIKPWFFNIVARRYRVKVLSEIAVREGCCVADLGSGGGYFVCEFAARVGTGGTVYAVDCDSRNLGFVGKETRRRGFADRVVLVLAEPDDFILPASSCDIVFTRNSFHHIDTPGVYFQKVAAALRPDGILAVIDYDGTGLIPHRNHFSNPEKIREELGTAGFRLSRTIGGFPGISFQIFGLQSAASLISSS